MAVRFSAVRLRTPIAHGLDTRPAIIPARPTLPRPPHPAPAFSDDRETPLFGDGMATVLELIWEVREADYFRGNEFKDLRRRANQ